MVSIPKGPLQVQATMTFRLTFHQMEKQNPPQYVPVVHVQDEARAAAGLTSQENGID